MHPYEGFRLVGGPDKADIASEARKSSVGHLRGKGGDYRSALRNTEAKAQTRRTMKRSAKAKALKAALRDADY